ncbi:cytochrome c [Myxococcota bacterium]|nr:cytochrome c [Myxococcota bacterium]
MRTRPFPTASLWAALAVATLSPHALGAKVPTKMPEDKVRGRELYQDLCWQCHGVEGRGDGPLAALLGAPPGDLRGRAEADWPALVDRVLQGQGDMPAFAESLDRHEARRILVWLAALDAGEQGVAATRVLPEGPVDTEASLARPAEVAAPGASAPDPADDGEEEAR